MIYLFRVWTYQKAFARYFIVTTLLKLKVYQIFISCGSFLLLFDVLKYLEYISFGIWKFFYVIKIYFDPRMDKTSIESWGY